MRVLVLTYEFPPVGGGGGRAAQDICQGLVKRGHEVHVLTAYMKGLAKEENIEGVKVTRVRSARRSAHKADLFAMGGFVIAGSLVGLNYIRVWQPDIVHVHFAVPTGASAWAINRMTGTPYVLTVHLGDIPRGVPQKTDRWFRWIYPFTHRIWRDAAQVVAVSEFGRQLALKHYAVDIQVIPNGADLSELDPGTISVGSPPRIVFAGRFVTQKNPVGIVRVLGSLRDLDWHCVLIGDGPLRSEVMYEIENAALQGRFTLPGWVSPEEVIDQFSRSDILFMPSLSEGLPVVGVQALAMGLAIVASRVGGFVDLIEEGENGYLYSPDDLDGMGQGLRKLLTDRGALLDARVHSRKLAKRFDIDGVAERYEQIFNQVLKSRGIG